MAVVECEAVELVDQRDRPIERQVVLERLRDQLDVPVPERVVDDGAHALGPEQRRVELDDDVDVVTGDEVLRDRLDLVGRAAVERRQRDRVGDVCRELEVAEPGEHRVVGDLRAQSLDLVGRIVHRVDEAGDLVGPDAGEVVADRHVEHVRAGPTVIRVTDELAERLPVPQHLDDHPRLDVLLEALVDEELLAPLDVVPDRLHVDARAGDPEIIEDLDRLEFEQPGATEPRQHDVLCHLAVWTGGRADRGGRGAPEEFEREVDVGVGSPEPRRRQVEDPFAGRPLVLDPREQHGQRHRCERWRRLRGRRVGGGHR